MIDSKINDVKLYARSFLRMVLVALLFSLAGVYFLIEGENGAGIGLRIIVGCALSVLWGISIYHGARISADKYYKLCSSRTRSVKTSIVEQTAGRLSAIQVDEKSVVFHVLPLFVISFIFAILASALKSKAVHAVNFFLYMPASVVFTAVGAINVNAQITWASAIIYIIYALINSAVFCVGFILHLKRLDAQRRDMAREVRSFNN